jgi:hypothetical protein
MKMRCVFFSGFIVLSTSPGVGTSFVSNIDVIPKVIKYLTFEAND